MNLYDIIEMYICQQKNITPEQLQSKSRDGNIIYALYLILFFAKEHNIGSLQEVASRYGRDHSTAHHAIKTINNYIETDKYKREEIDKYRTILKQLVDATLKINIHKKMFDQLDQDIQLIMAKIKILINDTFELKQIFKNFNNNETI